KTSRLKSLISKHNRTNGVPHLMLGDVTYSKSAHLKKVRATAERVALKPVTAIIQHAEKAAETAVKGKKSELSFAEAANIFVRMAKNDLNELLAKMGIVSCYVKNHAFSEEREVRLLALAPPPEARNYRVRDGIFIPFIKIFENGRLPIERILLGPHKFQARQHEALVSYLRARRLNVEVSRSTIPFVKSE